MSKSWNNENPTERMMDILDPLRQGNQIEGMNL